MIVVAIAFWVCAGLLIYTQVGYGVLLWLLSLALRGRRQGGARRAWRISSRGSNKFDSHPASRPASVPASRPASVLASPLGSALEAEPLPRVSVIVAAYAEQDVIAARVANLRAQLYPADRLEVIVACDGSPDETAVRARAAGADLVLELPRGGKVVAQDEAVRHATGELFAFSDANPDWAPDALIALVQAFLSDPRVGYACGEVTLLGADGDNQEGLYWRYEMWLRALESRLSSITAGNGAIYATRPQAYFVIGPLAGHDLSFPFGMVKRGWRAVYVPAARATEKMAPSIEGEFARKRRMARRTWPTVFGGGLSSPRGYSPLYALMIISHRVLRYLSPFLHLVALATSLVLVGSGWVYVVAAAVQVAVLAGALIAPLVPTRPLLVARYYVVTTAALAIGLWDWLRGDRSPVWETVAGTR